MYAARLTLPASIPEEDMLEFSQALYALEDGTDKVSISVLRENNHHKGPWVLEWLSLRTPDEGAIKAQIVLWRNMREWDLRGAPDFKIEKISEDKDWLKETYRAFPPFSIGPFFIYGSHYEGAVPDGQMGLKIDAATAFGSGEHGTTSGCLRAMLELKDQGACPWNVLDMGTGSGILAIAAWKLWKTPVLAVDNDEEATRVAARHCEMNGIPPGATGVTCDTGDGFNTPIVNEKKPYDLIIANILAGPLKEMAPQLAAVSDENGYVILSGILNEQAESVLEVYGAQGFKLRKRYEIADWSSLLLQKAAA